MKQRPQTGTLDKWCPKCGRMVPREHKHWGRAAVVAMPQIKPDHDPLNPQ